MLRRFAFAIAILGIAAAARPQERAASIAAASAEGGLRVIAPADVVRIRVQVLTPAGTTMFDSGWTEGNVLDWALRDPFGHAVPFGTYRFVTTSADVAGRVSTREGSLHLQPGETRIESEDLAVAAPDAVPSMIRLAHNGDAGLVVTTRGDLAFRFGDFLARKDVELMRLTAAGNLDVSGFVRAGRGILFSDGTILQSAAAANILHLPGYQPAVAVSGVGTTNRLTKWADTVGTLTDSVVTELNGKVGIGTSTPGTLLHVFGAPAQDVFSGLGPDPVLGPAMNYGYAGSSFGRGAGFFNVRPDGSATTPNPS
ncbi:MAG: hypothetical protein ACXVIJ_10145, partial [Thermoanaerobaculia bacterium]